MKSSLKLVILLKLFEGVVVFEFKLFDRPSTFGLEFFSLRTRDCLRTAGPAGRENCLIYSDFLTDAQRCAVLCIAIKTKILELVTLN